MKTEQYKTLGALKIAVQMEIDGKEHYLKASQKSSNELGKRLLASLAMEEDVHQQKFEEVYDARVIPVYRNNKFQTETKHRVSLRLLFMERGGSWQEHIYYCMFQTVALTT